MWSWGLTILSLVGVVLNIYHDRRCFFIWIGTNFCWMLVDFWYTIYAQAFLHLVYLFLAAYGAWRWRK
jgi:hypothetical protein